MITTPATWLRLVGGLALIFSLFQWSATTLHSDRGQAGVIVAALVVAATLSAEVVLFRQRQRDAARALGLGVPGRRGLIAAAAVSALLLLVVPLFAAYSRTEFSLAVGWLGSIPGLFAQAGIAEETLFRGWLFGHLRHGRSFRDAAVASMVPFVAVHLFLFFTMEWPIAVAAVLLAAVLSFPFAYLFELGGYTIWAPAIVHFIIQGTVKLVIMRDGGGVFPIWWMLAGAIVPQLVFLFPLPARSKSRGLERF